MGRGSAPLGIIEDLPWGRGSGDTAATCDPSFYGSDLMNLSRLTRCSGRRERCKRQGVKLCQTWI